MKNSAKPVVLPRSEKRQRQVFLIARCTADEKIQAEERASQVGLSLGDFVRAKVIGQKPLKTVRRLSPSAEAILLLKAELNKIGSNVNQIAKVANQTGKISPEQISRALEHLSNCYDEIIKISRL